MEGARKKAQTTTLTMPLADLVVILTEVSVPARKKKMQQCETGNGVGWWVHTPHHNFNTHIFKTRAGDVAQRSGHVGSFIGSLVLTKVIVKQVVDGLGEVSKLGRHGVEVVCVCGVPSDGVCQPTRT
jgi:hypothetical protein